MLLLSIVFGSGLLTGCASSAGKAAKHKAKKASPVHETKGEKVKNDVGDKGKSLKKDSEEKMEKAIPDRVKGE